MRGDGFIYKRGTKYWIGYNVGGTFRREPAGTSKAEAKAKLKLIHEAIRGGGYLAPDQRKVTVNDLLDELIVDLTNRGKASAHKVASHLRAVRAAMGDRRAIDLDTPTIKRFQRDRLEAGRAPATINRELEALRQAFRMAANVTPPRIPRAPAIPMLTVENARQGFLSRAEVDALLAAIPDVDLRDFLEWFAWTGMRPNEIRQLTWTMLDRETWTLTLDPKAAKTRQGRVLAIVGPLRKIIDRRTAARRLDCSLIFHRVSHRRAGQRVYTFPVLWRKALAAAHLPAGLRPYDLRRTALRNLVRGGTDYTVAMKISGHKTRSTFDRYNITSVDDIRAAMNRTADYVATLPTERNVEAFDLSQKTHNQGAKRKAR